jgi:hypothetical protein
VSRRLGRWRRALLLAAAAACAPAAAQEFGVYLLCKGTVQAGGKSMPAHVDIALRRNSQLAMIQASDILPAGQRMRLDMTPQFYTMVYQLPLQGSAAYRDWLTGALVVWNPVLRSLNTIRISVNRQSAALEGELRDGLDALVGRLHMKCDPKDNATVEQPKF